MSDPRRYFPDWTHCALGSGRESEADHNSYLAGGYAEEFGYMATAEWSRGVPVLDGPPDRFRKRRGLAEMTHPGYPLRAHPFVPGAHEIESMARIRMRRRATRIEFQNAGMADLPDHGTYFTVHMRPDGDKHASPLRRAAKRAAVRLASSIVGLRWALRHR